MKITGAIQIYKYFEKLDVVSFNKYRIKTIKITGVSEIHAFKLCNNGPTSKRLHKIIIDFTY